MNSKALKDRIRRMARESSIDPQVIMQNYFLERFLERVSMSEYRDKIVLKGGLLIASMIGISKRSTMDMDATLQGYPVAEDDIFKMLDDIIQIQLTDDVHFEIQSLKEIRHDDEYKGYRVVILSSFERIKQHIKVDISTGDVLTPSEIEYEYMPLFGDHPIKVMAYNLETILAEKIETVLRRGEDNTRMRDFYDIHILRIFRSDEIDEPILKSALRNTARRRETTYIFDFIDELQETIRSSKSLEQYWLRYQSDYAYASNISYSEIIESLDLMIDVAI